LPFRVVSKYPQCII